MLQGVIPVVHINTSGLNAIPGVGVYNSTGINLDVLTVLINHAQIPIARLSVPEGYTGAVQFANPVLQPTMDI